MTYRNWIAGTAIVLVAASSFASVARAEDSNDSSGTNPAVLSRTASISNEYRFLTTDDYYPDDGRLL